MSSLVINATSITTELFPIQWLVEFYIDCWLVEWNSNGGIRYHARYFFFIDHSLI